MNQLVSRKYVKNKALGINLVNEENVTKRTINSNEEISRDLNFIGQLDDAKWRTKKTIHPQI